MSIESTDENLARTDARYSDVKNRLAQRRKELRSLNAFAREVTSDLPLHDVLRLVHEHISNNVRPDLAVIYLIEENALVSLGEWPENPTRNRAAPKRKKVGQCLCGLAAERGTPVYSIDIRTDVRCTLEECKNAGLRSFAAIPLLDHDTVIGVLGMASRLQRDFSEQGDYLETLASYIAREILERKRAKPLATSDKSLHSIFRAAPIGIGLVFDRVLSEVNDRICDMVGRSREELLGKSARILYGSTRTA